MTIHLTLRFHGPFRISSGHAGEGTDHTIDRDNPLPATSLKGVLRDAARLVLPTKWEDESSADTPEDKTWEDDPLVNAVFGWRGGQQSPWHFSDAIFPEGDLDARVQNRVRIRLGENRTVAPGAMFLAEELHVQEATAEITQRRPLTEEQRNLHEALLHVSARLVDGLGASRRRGLGWVSIVTDARDLGGMVQLLSDYREKVKT